MDRIVIEVDKGAKKAYNELSSENKKQLQEAVNIWLIKKANDESFAAYQNFLDIMGTKAAKNGLTPEILDELLKSND
jgi:hypothetical protein